MVGTYAPRIEVRVAETISSTIIAPDSALKLIARKAFVDRNGQPRKAGEEWLIREPGAYMPDVDEQVSAVVQPHFLKQTVALHLRAADTFIGQRTAHYLGVFAWLYIDFFCDRRLQHHTQGWRRVACDAQDG